MKINLQKIVIVLMDDFGLDQGTIAAECDCSQPTISHIRRNIWGNSKPSFKMATNLTALAEKHGINPNGTRMRKKKAKS